MNDGISQRLLWLSFCRALPKSLIVNGVVVNKFSHGSVAHAVVCSQSKAMHKVVVAKQGGQPNGLSRSDEMYLLSLPPLSKCTLFHSQHIGSRFGWVPLRTGHRKLSKKAVTREGPRVSFVATVF
jgi:hypothetical protein